MIPSSQPVVLYLIDSLFMLGGTERHLLELASRLPTNGFRPTVCCLDSGKRDGTGVDIPDVEVRYRDIRRLYSPAGRRIAESITQRAIHEGVGLVQTFHFKSDWLGVRVARALRCPLVSSRRDLGFNQTPIRKLIYRFINNRVDAFIAPSKAVGNVVSREKGVDPQRVKVIFNGIDLRGYETTYVREESRAWLGVSGEGPLIGMVSSLRPIKDHPTLLRAMKIVVDARPDARLALIGSGSDAENLKQLAGDLGLSNAVTFSGSRDDIPRALAALDVFVLSTHSEGMSNAIIEAMAAGLPVVATDVGGNAECVVHGETGFLTPHEDVSALAERLLTLIGHPDQARMMGAAGRQRALREFDVNEMVRRTTDLYRSLMKDTTRGIT